MQPNLDCLFQSKKRLKKKGYLITNKMVEDIMISCINMEDLEQLKKLFQDLLTTKDEAGGLDWSWPTTSWTLFGNFPQNSFYLLRPSGN